MFKYKFKIPTNFYLIVGLYFLLWMIFFDANDLYEQWQLRSKRIELEEEKAYYKKRIIEVEQDREALLKDKEKLEEFAREKYYMRKDNEDVYVVIEED